MWGIAITNLMGSILFIIHHTNKGYFLLITANKININTTKIPNNIHSTPVELIKKGLVKKPYTYIPITPKRTM